MCLLQIFAGEENCWVLRLEVRVSLRDWSWLEGHSGTQCEEIPGKYPDGQTAKLRYGRNSPCLEAKATETEMATLSVRSAATGSS
jgi:hypothetical protein